MNRIVDNIYIGNWFDAFSIRLKNENNIIAIVNCTDDIPNFVEDDTIHYLRSCIPRYATMDETTACKIIRFIDKYREIGGVLVHCSSGMQRSPSVVILYLVSIGETLENATRIVSKEVEYFLPNDPTIDLIRRTDVRKLRTEGRCDDG